MIHPEPMTQGILPGGKIVSFSLQQYKSPPHEFEVVFCPEVEEGGYSVFALHYPGVISQGDTLEEAEENIKEAFVALLEARKMHAEEMEFSNNSTIDIQKGWKRAWVRVNG